MSWHGWGAVVSKWQEKLELGRHSNGYMGSHHHHGDEPGPPPQLIASGRHSHGVLLKSISPKIRKVKSETYSVSSTHPLHMIISS